MVEVLANATDRIQILSRQLANQIAAGEVIERPASVLKELLENSIDAHASSISIYIEKAGKKLIAVCDNGDGIHADDLLLSVKRHATSKIKSEKDLTAISSLGFRGEALASISACSKLSIASKHQSSEVGYKLEMAPGDQAIDEPQKCAHPVGTTIRVENLFYNLPARRKFLRTDKTEWLHVLALFDKLAMSQPNIEFKLYHDDKLIKHLPKVSDENLQLRVKKVIGQSFFASAKEVHSQAVGLSLSGWLGAPDEARSQSDCQYCYINGRMVRDRMINHAIRQAYDAFLYEGRYPSYVLYLEIAPDALDVNVHPTKHEVRFSETRLVHDFIYTSISRSLSAESESPDSPIAKDIPIAQSHNDYVSSIKPLQSAQPVAQKVHETRPATTSPNKPLPNLNVQYLGSLGQQCLFAKTKDAFIVANLHALDAALSYQQLSQSLTENNSQKAPLSKPFAIKLNETIIDAVLKDNLFQTLGFELARIAPEELIIRGVPYALRHMSFSEYLAEDFTKYAKLDNSTRIMHMACKASQQKLSELTPSERMMLLTMLDTESEPKECACGTPCFRVFNEEQLVELIKINE